MSHKKEIEFAEKIRYLLEKSPSEFHVIDNCKKLLKDSGFEQLNESEQWNLKPNGKYFLTRNNSSICAFKMPKAKLPVGFMVASSHSDSPCYSLQECDNKDTGKYYVVSLEKYGSIQQYSYIDVPLSVAGKILVKKNNCVKTKLVNIDKPCLFIPNVAPHLNKEVIKKGLPLLNLDKQLRPFFSLNKSSNIIKYIAEHNNIKYEDVIDWDLIVYRCTKPFIWGENDEFLSSRAIDDQVSTFTSIYGLIESNLKDSIAINFIFDNEEPNSMTKAGADSKFAPLILDKIVNSINLSDKKHSLLINSFALSIDNTHAIHPNFDEFSNKYYSISLGDGIAIKRNTNKSYQTNAVGSSIVKLIAQKNDIKVKTNKNHFDSQGGGTLAKYLESQTSILTADIGIPQLSMHSALETCSTYDLLHMKNFVKAFYSSTLIMESDNSYKLI